MQVIIKMGSSIEELT